MKKQILLLLLSLASLTGFAQTYDTKPVDALPYGSQLYKRANNDIIAGLGSAKFRTLDTKQRVDSIIAVMAANLSTGLATKINNTEKGAINGVATLDASGKVPLSQTNDALLGSVNYQGNYNATTNVPTLPAATGNKGKYYVVSTGGTTQGITFVAGDWIISNGTIWQKVDNNNAVTSVAGRTGAVTLSKTDVGLANVDNTSDANKPVSTATQTALNLKANIASPTFTGTVTAPTFVGAFTGNASTATKLATPVFINGVSFDGSSSITVADNTKLALTGGQVTGQVLFNSQTTNVINQLALSSATSPQLGESAGLTINNRAGLEYDGTYGGLKMYGISNLYPLIFANSGTPGAGEFARFSGTGNFGINQNNPQEKLDVVGNGKFTGTVTAPTFVGALTGNSSTATTLQTARNINGVPFNGSADITVVDAAKLPLAGGNMTGDIVYGGAFSSSVNPTASAGLSFSKFSDYGKIYFESPTSDDAGTANLIFENGDNLTDHGGPTEGFIFRKFSAIATATTDIFTINNTQLKYKTYDVYHAGNLPQLKTDLGLGTNAYNSTAYLPLTGGTLTGNLIVNTKITSGTGTNGGFENASSTSTTHNNIWRFSNSPEYGIGYYGAGTMDNIGFHFGDRNTPLHRFYADGSVTHTGSLSAVGATISGLSSILKLKSTATSGANYIDFKNSANTSTGFIGQVFSNNDLTYVLANSDTHRFYIAGVDEFDIAANGVTSIMPITAAPATLSTQLATLGQAGYLKNVTASGTGSTTQITIAHGLTGITASSSAIAQARNAASANIQYVTVDATNIYINYSVAPVSGSSNLSYTIHIKP